MHDIIVEKPRKGPYLAYTAGDLTCVTQGETKLEAVANLILAHKGEFNISSVCFECDGESD